MMRGLIGVALAGLAFARAGVVLAGPSRVVPSGSSVSDLTREAERVPIGQRDQLLRRLSQVGPRDGGDVDALIAFAKGGPQQRKAAVQSFKRAEGLADQMLTVRISAHIDSFGADWHPELVGGLLDATVRWQAKECTPRLVRKLRGARKVEIANDTQLARLIGRQGRGHADNFFDKVDPQAMRVQMMASAIAALGGEQHIDLLFERDEYFLSGVALTDLARKGPLALQRAIKEARGGSPIRRRQAVRLIALSSAESNRGLLLPLANDPDESIRLGAVHALGQLRGAGVDAALTQMAADSSTRVMQLALREQVGRDPAAHRKEILDALYGRGQMNRMSALLIVRTGRVHGLDRELEEFIRWDERENPNNSLVRKYVAEGLWKSSGKKVQYRRGQSGDAPYPWEGAPAR